MMAKLHDEPFDGKDWIFEIKWDGYRAIAEIEKKGLRLYSRNGLSFENDYPAVFEALKSIDQNVVLDGEIVALDEHGLPSFQLLQNAGRHGAPLCYYVFDILYKDGKSLESKPLLERKNILQELLPSGDLIRYCDHVAGKGKDFFKVVRDAGMEGMIAKKASSLYAEGSRSSEWLKVKHLLTDEAVIAGFTQARGARKFFGALVLGMYKDGVLEYIGHTGTGFTSKSLKEMHELLKPIITVENPFGKKVPLNAPVTWVLPELVCNIRFTEVTEGGNRRHPVFMGLRKDKSAEEVTGADAAEEPEQTAKKSAGKSLKTKAADMETSKKVGGHTLKFTNTDKVFWPDEGFTKGDVIAYYESVSKYILKYLKDRPLSLKRNPNGIADGGFYHKDAGDSAPDWVTKKEIWSGSNNKDINYIICNDKATLLYLANLGCIEINPWHSRVESLDNPDYFIMDLDPSAGNTFEQVIETAHAVKEVLDKAGAASVVKTSGSTGLHIYVPLGAKYTYDEANAFAGIIAAHAQELVPDFTSIERSLKKRGDNIYIDFMQNNVGQTIAAPYSIRPKPGATVSAPLDWSEVKTGLGIDQFDIRNMVQRIEQKGDLFSPVMKKGIDLIKCLKRLEK